MAPSWCDRCGDTWRWPRSVFRLLLRRGRKTNKRAGSGGGSVMMMMWVKHIACSFSFLLFFFLTFICAGRIWHNELISCHADEAGRVWDENSFWSGESVTSRFISSSFFIYVSLSPTFFFVVAGKRSPLRFHRRRILLGDHPSIRRWRCRHEATYSSLFPANDHALLYFLVISGTKIQLTVPVYGSIIRLYIWQPLFKNNIFFIARRAEVPPPPHGDKNYCTDTDCDVEAHCGIIAWCNHSHKWCFSPFLHHLITSNTKLMGCIQTNEHLNEH